MSRLILQIVNGTMGLSTAFLGTLQMSLGIHSPLYAAADLPIFPALDSNLRFFGGMGLGLGLILIWITPSIEKQGLLFRAVWICAFLGGIGRLISILSLGRPSGMLMAFTIIEILGTPLLIFWQYHLSTNAIDSN